MSTPDINFDKLSDSNLERVDDLQSIQSLKQQEFTIKVLDETTFSAQTICRLHHNYHLHPLMQLDSLEKLAISLNTTGQCRFIDPDTEVSSPFNHKPRSPHKISVEEVFDRIEEPGSWIALYDVQTDPTYRTFLRKAMNSVAHLIGDENEISDVRGFIFISAPPSVTPFHIDRENNFWLQIKGQKKMSLWHHTDREIVAAKDIEQFIVYKSLDNVRLRDEMKARSVDFDCGPGDGVFFPSTTPHATQSSTDWVTPGDGVTISIGIVFYTKITRLEAYVHAANRLLRKLGLNPRDPGISDAADSLKYFSGRIVVAIGRLRGYVPPPGF